MGGGLDAFVISILRGGIKCFFDITKVMAMFIEYMEDAWELSKTACIPMTKIAIVEIATAAMYQA